MLKNIQTSRTLESILICIICCTAPQRGEIRGRNLIRYIILADTLMSQPLSLIRWFISLNTGEMRQDLLLKSILLI
ncbi:hypothetical protein WT57_09760 [Burkholderia pseudomultivorans]|uniref:Uncharacterized protein n=1 Tax=Burkholderia pseudomultivorans TaxID=1207504 RepID=A0A132F5H1_9BURK|nr:hypothetical protein WT57_09760 [Burkholderia pseudomultivorans]